MPGGETAPYWTAYGPRCERKHECDSDTQVEGQESSLKKQMGINATTFSKQLNGTINGCGGWNKV